MAPTGDDHVESRRKDRVKLVLHCLTLEGVHLFGVQKAHGTDRAQFPVGESNTAQVTVRPRSGQKPKDYGMTESFSSDDIET